jgi:hypothetical protein
MLAFYNEEEAVNLNNNHSSHNNNNLIHYHVRFQTAAIGTSISSERSSKIDLRGVVDKHLSLSLWI